MTMDVLDLQTLAAHDNFIARRLVVMAWLYNRMYNNLDTDIRLHLPYSFVQMGANLMTVADVMWQEHGDWAYEQQKADLHKTKMARYN